MSKKQVLNEIMDLYDENEMLKGKIKEYTKIKKSDTGESVEVFEETEKDKIFNVLNDKAKMLLFEKCFYDWHLPSVKVKEDSGEFNFLTFEQWFKAINISNCLCSDYRYMLDDLTQNEVKNYFRPQFEVWFNDRLNREKMELVRAKKDE